MTRAAWAERIAENKWCDVTNVKVYALGLKAEHKRAVRVVKRLEKAVKLGKYSLNNDQFAGYMGALRHVLAALQKGRT